MKTQVYSWRLSPERKNALQEAARERQKSLAELLETITDEWLELQRRKAQEDDEAEQRRMLAQVMEVVGTIEGEYNWSSEIRQGFGEYLDKKYEKSQRPR